MLPQIHSINQAALATASLGALIAQESQKNTLTKVLLNALQGIPPNLHQITEADRIFSSLRNTIVALTRKAAKPEIDEKLLATLALKTTPNTEAYFQALAQDASYHDWESGSLLPKSELFEHPGYRVKKIIEFKGGVRAIIAVSEDLAEAPLIVFRGTDANNVHNLADDVNYNIGELNYTRYKEELEREIQELAIDHGRVHIMGHSYGGTMAQLLTAKYPQLIKRCTYYNAPAVGEKAVQEFALKVSELSNDMPKPEVWSYRHAKDLASLLGGQPLPTEENHNFTHGTSDEFVSHVDAHSLNTLSTGAEKSHVFHADESLMDTGQFIEKCRRAASGVIPLYKEIVRATKAL